MKSKKGLMFELLIFVAIIILLVYAFTVLYQKHGQFPPGYRIGDRQFSLMSAIQEAEVALFYVDQSADYMFDKSINELAKKGGIFVENNCGIFNGANVWYTVERADSGYRETDCFDDAKVQDNLKEIFDENLDAYLGDNPYNLPKNNYEYKVENSQITGFAKADLVIDIKRKN